MKRIIILLVAITMIFTLAACGKQVTEAPEDNDGNENEVVDPSPDVETVVITLYFMNEEYVITGNEELEKIIEVNREVTIGEKPIEEVVMEELKKTTEGEELYTALANIKVLSVETAESTAYVNLSSENLFGGSLEESSILTQVVLSLTEIDGIDSVQFLVDGSKRETLMGHYLIEEPLNRDEFNF
ncbi:GerMN domain-containing protein [Alkaliphilus peptidifermentans]|uniref:Sporulation and spore germination n=1 Tax=Alkaliphilus peptidifermentans DSM 18978 TaxID=1120976 RepID=A0A1G5JFA2_9FIRM|nr:GerMN domain-containing protein [Alkaliphilus peptidifermentans]SCY87032.1 Sporulation and spore germination [Alkaliphilus peptidifermentans DSM 18978]